MRHPSILLLALCCLILAPGCFARPKNDVVTLLNGNAITCDIQSLSRGVLTAKTDSLKTVSIRWEDVTRIQSGYVYEIMLADRSIHYGDLKPDAAGNLQIPGTAAIPLVQVVALTHIESRFLSRFDGSFDAGYSFLKSDATTQLNVDGNLNYTTRRSTLSAQVFSTLLIRSNTSSTRRNEFDLGLNENISRGYFALAIGQFQSNDDLNLLQRYLGGAGFGRYLKRTNRSIVTLFGGGAYSSEHYTGTGRLNNGEGLIGANAQFFRLYSPKLDVTGDFKLWPSLTVSGRYRIDANFKARLKSTRTCSSRYRSGIITTRRTPARPPR